MKQEQHFQLTKFVTAVPMAFHKVCGVSNVTPTLTFPKGEYEVPMSIGFALKSSLVQNEEEAKS